MERQRTISWLLLLGAIVLVQVFGSSGCFLEEKAALLDFKRAFVLELQNTTSSDYVLLPSWLNDPKSNCCGWERVTCDSSSGHVIHLSLDNLTKYMHKYGPEESQWYCSQNTSFNWSLFLSFKELRSLNLSDNCIDRFIWKGEYRRKSTIKRLETLDLSHNSLNEKVMESLSALTSLKNLTLAANFIGGHFPIKELSLLRSLELLDLSENELGSPLTTQDTNALYRLNKLKTLNLAGNNFNEGIFKSLVALPALRSLFLGHNNITGHLDDKGALLALRSLFLGHNNITGRLDENGICKLKHLQELDLSENSFIGTLHTCLGNLTSLRALDLSHNFFSGSIPAPLIARLISLEFLSLSHNRFEGLFSLNTLAIHSKLKVLQLGDMDSKMFQVETENPPWIPSFQLEYLQISYCQVNLPTKSIPTFLSYQHDLRYVDLSHNNMVGMFPSWLLVNNPKLEVVFLNDNSFTGPFKLPFDPNHHKDQLDQLQILDLSNNQIQGELPDNIGLFFPHLEYFNVSSNKFDGHIPTSIGEMSRMEGLDLANNNFSGEVEHIFLGCISLYVLILSNNSLQGKISSIPTKWEHLWVLMMDNNHFNGTLPIWIGEIGLNIFSASRNNFEGEIIEELCQNVPIFIDLSHNRFSGGIPSCLSSTIFIHLRGNSLTGTIPEALLNSSSLVTIDLRDNKFMGTIPEKIYGPGFLHFVLLAGNQLQGQLSNQICQLKKVNILDLSRNNFTGSLPSCFNESFGKAKYFFTSEMVEYWNTYNSHFAYKDLYPHFSLHPDYSDFSFTREVVQFITKGLSLSYTGDILSYMSGLDLSSNQFTGEIPHQLGDLIALHALNLSHNHLNGPIPESFHKLENLESLDLSNNNLSGQIPLQLQDLNYLSVFNVSYNNFSGRAPDKGQFATFDENSYKGNPYLTVINSNRGNATPPPPPTPSNDSEKNVSAIDFTFFYWSFVASYVMVLLMLVTILWINPHWRREWFYFIEGCLLKCVGQFLENAFY